jgi:hypothetical protein
MHGEVQFVHYLKQSRQAFCSLHILILTNFLLWYTPDTTSLTPHIHLFSPDPGLDGLATDEQKEKAISA